VDVILLSEMESLMSKGGKSSVNGLHMYSVQGCDFLFGQL
jgi:hypothetical protein